MLRNRLYYFVKPFLPASVRVAVRRWFAVRQRRRVTDVWPIMPGSEVPPEGWAGWPEGHQFSLVLTHDVEGQSGLDKCRQLMEIELRHGFRSSFNFIPEGEYSVPASLREELKRNGFEVGVHDLHHDGKIFHSRAGFVERAARINAYLKDWGAHGFRAGFMLNNLEWLHDLDIQYDASTFDTDPFEPQPQGRHTIFPFWIPSPCTSRASSARGGYVELPYTLPQDSTLFRLFCERHPDIWFQKLDWLASHGGMVLLNTHPDYMAMPGETPVGGTYPVELYERFLERVRTKYAGKYWHALPHEVASLVHNAVSRRRAAGLGAPFVKKNASPRPKIWIDLDNTPHVPFFEPILDELKARGFPVMVTARDAFQVCELADKKGLGYLKVGRHHGKNRFMKATGLLQRGLQLLPHVLREKPAIGVSHGARSQLLVSNWLRIPTVLIEDYEHCQFPPMMRPTWIMAPDVIPDDMLPCKKENIRKYSGIKEDVYAWKLDPDPNFLAHLGLSSQDLIVTVRPPATEAHYHNPESEKLFEAFMQRACATPGVRVVLLPRNSKQGDLIRATWPDWFKNNQTIIPKSALDGLNLIWFSDLVVSGGGTMNREAAALGVPVYSIFRGTIGAVDKQLSKEGRLVLITSVDDADKKIILARRTRRPVSEVTSRQTLLQIVDSIEKIADSLAR